MSRMLRFNPATKHLDLGRVGKGGGDSRKMEIALTLALGLIIVGAIAMIVMSLAGGPEAAKDRGPMEMHFECVDCGHTFVLTADELNAAAPNVMMEEAGAIRVKCPKCGKEKSAYPATKCPKCEKYFLAENTKREAKILADMDADMDAAKEAGQTYERPRYELVKNVCPHCGQDIAEWYREKYRRKKKK